jgi:hypothetical protein
VAQATAIEGISNFLNGLLNAVDAAALFYRCVVKRRCFLSMLIVAFVRNRAE